MVGCGFWVLFGSPYSPLEFLDLSFFVVVTVGRMDN